VTSRFSRTTLLYGVSSLVSQSVTTKAERLNGKLVNPEQTAHVMTVSMIKATRNKQFSNLGTFCRRSLY